MHVYMILYLLGCLRASMCVNQVEYEDDYADNYYNEISQDQQGGEWSLVLLLHFIMKDFSCLISES